MTNECYVCGEEFNSCDSISVSIIQNTSNVRSHTDQRVCLRNLLVKQEKLETSVAYAHTKIQGLLEAQSKLQEVVSTFTGKIT